MTKKPATAVTVKDLSECFNDRVLLSLTRGFVHIILVFDIYKKDSLKSTTRSKRRHGEAPVQYEVIRDTSIEHVTISRFLSHEQTKADLADYMYLANKTLVYNLNCFKVIVVSASGRTSSNRGVQSESNNHEEAHTLMIQLAITESLQFKCDIELTIFSPDTDVLVPAWKHISLDGI